MSMSLFELVARNIDRRLALSRPGRRVANKIFPHHWSFLLGEIALISFVILVLTGIFLTMFYRPSIESVVYTGSAAVYTDSELPSAYASLVRLTYDVPAGDVFRRIHRFAAHVFVAAIILHGVRIFLTGAFRKPREVNYIIGILLLLLGIGAGFTGQILPYDVIAGVTLRITYSFLLSIPYVGPQLAFWVFGGEFLTADVLYRMYVMHVLIIPALIAAVVTVHLALIVRQRHTQLPHERIDGQRMVVGTPLWPWQFVISTSLVLIVVLGMVVASILVPWSDTALHGPYFTGNVSNAAQPEWFLMWVEGALRVVPQFEIHLLGTVISQVFVIGVVLPGLVFGALIAYPFLERRRHPIADPQHVLEHPLDVPLRLGLFTAGSTFLVILTVAAMNDYIARNLGLDVEAVIWVFRVATPVLPPILGYVAARYARTHRPIWGVSEEELHETRDAAHA
jgi:ubiquinol-cytochrome c reductase cytochrome b subunit